MGIYFPPSLRGFEARRMVFSTWIEHLPFGYDLVTAIRPRTLVELGVFNGLSYFAFCQAVEEQGLETRCYAVDTWEGDKHTDVYDDDIWEDVESHNSEHYSGFSTLLRMTFNEALPRFSDESLDMIHLDGLHTYEAVREDFTNWYPKLCPGGLFLFHDIRARLHDFGVWRFWDELEREHETFAFNHCFGLGVLRKPGGSRENDPALLDLLFHGDRNERQRLRAFYVYAAHHASLERKERRRERVRRRHQQERERQRSAGGG